MKKLIKYIQHHREEVAVLATIFFLLAGVLQYYAGLTYVLKLTPLVIGIITALVVLFWQIDHKTRLRLAIIVMLIGFVAEAIGVNSGLLFGDYQYSKSALGLGLFGVPLLVAVMWLLVSFSAWQIASLGGFKKFNTIILASFIVVAFDLILEQYATGYGLWSWQGGQIPIFNYISWFFVSFVMFAVISVLVKKNSISLYGIYSLPIMMGYFWLMLLLT